MCAVVAIASHSEFGGWLLTWVDSASEHWTYEK
jgi:hypothetical protein